MTTLTMINVIIPKLKRVSRHLKRCSVVYIALVLSLTIYFRWPNWELSLTDLDDFNLFYPWNVEFVNTSYLSHDPRWIPCLWLQHINRYLLHGIVESIRVPFNWHQVLRESDYEYSGSCVDFFDDFNIDIPYYNVSEYCDIDALGVRIKAPIDAKLSIKARKVIGHNFVSKSAPIPEKVMFLAGNKSLSVPTFFHNDMFAYHREHSGDSIMGIYGETDVLQDYLKELNDVSVDDSSINSVNVNTVKYHQQVDLDVSEFIFNTMDLINHLKTSIALDHKNHQVNDLDTHLLSNIVNELSHDPHFPKYFHEALISFNKAGGHFDWRFFKRVDYSHYEKIAILHKLTRAWLRFSSATSLKSWLSHGTLLGWYWNGMNLPWDNDLDIQMTAKSLTKLARNYNQTLVVDLNDHGTGQYLVDVSSNFFNREKQNGNNAIDARFIDIDTGFYVDITGLSFTNSSKTISAKEKTSTELNQMLNPNYLQDEQSTTVDLNSLHEKLDQRKKELWTNKEIFNCKNNHFYELNELSPLKMTLFEGIKAYVPQNYEGILKREYRKGLYNKIYNRHSFKPFLKLWIPQSVCSSDAIGKGCSDKLVLINYKYTKDLTQRHKQNMYYNLNDFNELGPIYIDPWIITYEKKLRKTKKLGYNR